jgi:hypothetical protein
VMSGFKEYQGSIAFDACATDYYLHSLFMICMYINIQTLK